MSEITLKSNEIKNITIVIRSLENGWNLSKGTTENVSEERGYLGNVLVPLMRIGVPVIKNVLTPLAERVSH